MRRANREIGVPSFSPPRAALKNNSLLSENAQAYKCCLPISRKEILFRRIPMSTQENLQVVKDGYAAFSRGDIPGLLAQLAEDVEWQIPGAGLPLAGTYRGHDGVANFFQKLAADTDILDFQPREFVAEGD